jgi:hypothetical protein
MTMEFNRNMLCAWLAMLSIGCAANQEEFEQSHWDVKRQGPIPNFQASYIEKLTPKMLPDSGFYYIYRPSDDRNQMIEPAKKLRRLFVLGVNITMAWYRPNLGGCSPPGSTLTTATIYPEVFVVRLENPNDMIRKYNFHPIPRPESFPCPYGVTQYLAHYE